MMSYKGLLLAAGFIGVVAAQDQPKPQLTARELFYSAVQSPATPAKAAPKSPAKAAPSRPIKAAPPKAGEAVTATSSPAQAAPAEPPSSTLPGGARIVPASLGPPLGLKYTILKFSGNQTMEVPADTTFHAGDRIQVQVETNVAGYLYIVNRGSSGTWQPIFPSPDVADGNNHVDGFHSYTMPPKSRIFFDEQPGIEKLFIVFSREPEPSLEKMVDSLQGKQPEAAPKQPEAAQKTLMAMAVDDATVGKLRTVYARDLVIEKVDEKTPETAGTKKETAVYVVNRSGSPDSRVVADLQLEHQ